MSLDQLPETPIIEQRPYVPERRRAVPTYVRVIGIVLAATFGLSTLGLILLGAISVLSVRAQDSTSQSFTVTSTPRLVVQNSVVDLHIATGSGNIITVRTERQASALTYGLAQRALQEMTAQASQSGDSVMITTHLPSFGDGIAVTEISMSVYVTVPQTANLDIRSDVGNIEVQGVKGTMTMASQAGNIRLDDVTLVGASSLRNQVGNTTCTCTLADSASLQVSAVAGNITLTLPRATSASLTASTDTGNVTVDSVWPVSVTRKNATGEVASGDLSPNPTGSITAQSTVGNITVLSR